MPGDQLAATVGVDPVRQLDTCSHTSRLPSTSNASPLPLNVGDATHSIPPASVQRQRASPGMSLKYSACSRWFQTGPSLNW